MTRLKSFLISIAAYTPMILAMVLLPKYYSGHDLAFLVALLTLLSCNLRGVFLGKGKEKQA